MRLDIALVNKGYVDSREKAKYLIKEGCVKVDGVIVTKPSKNINENSKIVLIKNFKFVGRGGYKIYAAVKHFGISFKDKVVVDVGCGGGFTSYALKHGAKRVYAIDTGDPLHKSLRKNKNVIYFPNTDARNVENLNEKVDMPD
jgi:23S rRNA (cytidine1920-2'-O)/16S rRNA (cytidine1409-2'-O)-methyltransferase